MTPESFITALVEAVHEASVSDTLSTLASGPSGRHPPASLLAASAWYQDLAVEDQLRVQQVVELAVHATLFGTLCVLDGSRTLEPSTEFQLFAVGNSEHVLLNAPDGECLHDEYQSHIYERVFGAGA